MSDVEKRLWDAAHRGEPLDLRPGEEELDDTSSGARWGSKRQVRATVLAQLLADDTLTRTGATRIVRLQGARITGPLTLRHAVIACPVYFEQCRFDDPVDIRHAHAVLLSFHRSQVPSIDGYGVQVSGDLDCTAVQSGVLNLFGARIGGQVWLNGAHFVASDGYWAITAPDMTVRGGIYARKGFTAEGGVNLYRAAIGSTLEFKGATITNPNQIALRAVGIKVHGDMYCTDGTSVEGSISLFGADIGGQLWLNGARLSTTQGFALNAPLLSVGGGVYARQGFTVNGGLNLFRADIGSTLEFDGATIVNPGGYALRAPGMKIRGNVTCVDGFTATGSIDLSHAQIDGYVDLATAVLDNGAGTSLDCRGFRVGTLEMTGWSEAPTSIDLRDAHVDRVIDDPGCWPERLHLDGFQYGALQPQLPAKQRLLWLGRDLGGYRPQPYEQLASHYLGVGHDDEARTVLLARQRRRRAGQRMPLRMLGYLEDGVVGYGYRPLRAFFFLAVLAAVVARYFAVHEPTAIRAINGPAFQPAIYALDLLLPILDLGQEKAFVAQGTGQWVGWFAILSGWVVATTIIAGVTRAVTRS